MAQNRTGGSYPGQYPRRAQYPASGYPVGGYGGRPQPQRAPQGGRPQPLGSKKKKRKKRESDFFYVHNRGVCFLLFLVCVLMIAVAGVNFLNMVPDLSSDETVGMILSYTSVFKEGDYTTYEEREAATVYDEEGNVLESYVDKSTYYLAGDLFMGALNSLIGAGSDQLQEDMSGTSGGLETVSRLIAFADETSTGSGSASGTESGSGTEEEVEVVTSPLFDKYTAKKAAALAAHAEYEGSIVFTIVEMAPLAIALYVLIALIMAILAFLALFGRRIFRGFALGSILCLVAAVAVLLTGIAMISVDIAVYNEKEELSLEFGQVAEFLTSAFNAPYNTIEEQRLADEEFAALQQEQLEAETTVSIKLPMQTNYGMYIMLALPAVALVLALFAKKKIPYAIFD